MKVEELAGATEGRPTNTLPDITATIIPANDGATEGRDKNSLPAPRTATPTAAMTEASLCAGGMPLAQARWMKTRAG